MPKEKPKTFTIPGTKIGQPEPIDWAKIILTVLFVIVCVFAGVWLMHRNGRYHPLECDNSSGFVGLTSWGSCHEAVDRL
jgi:hypothetical protein